MAHKFNFEAVCNVDGSINVQATNDLYNGLRDTLCARINSDQDTVAVEVDSFLLENPGMKTLSIGSLVRALWDRRIESGEYAAKTLDDGTVVPAKTRQEKDALAIRLEQILPEYLKGNPDLFHIGRKTGVAFAYVQGEYQKDAAGETVLDSEGNPIQLRRHSVEEWNLRTAPSPAQIAKAAAADAAEAAKVAASK